MTIETIKTICFDLDNVICRTEGNNYSKAKPNRKVIRFINQLYDKYKIIIFTARYMGRSKENSVLAHKKGYRLTKKQLYSWNLNHDKLIFGKPSYDYFIDDKAIGFNKNNWEKTLKKKLKIT